jgi:hypothetical protein
MTSLSEIKNENIAQHIYFIRGEKVMLDVDLASLYGVETRVLKQSVRRNISRFPIDFMFQLTEEEIKFVVSHSVIPSKSFFGGAQPFAFTEQGIAMLSGVLKTERAVQVNVAIMRTFVQMRKLMLSYKDLEDKIEKLEKKYDSNFDVIFKVIKQLIKEKNKPPRPIGYKTYDTSDKKKQVRNER